MKLKALSRKLTLKYAENFPPTMPSAPGAAMDVKIPKAPRVPVINEYTSNVKNLEENSPESDFEVKTPVLNYSPMNDSEIPSLPTLRPDQMAQMPEWKHRLLSAVDVIGHVSVITPIYHHDLIQKINRAEDDAVSEFEIKEEITSLITDAEKNAINFLHKMRSALHSIR